MRLTTCIYMFLIATPSVIVQGRLRENILQHPKLLDRLSDLHTHSFLRDEYIVVLDDSTEDVEAALKELLSSSGGEIKYVYKSIFKGGAISSLPNFRLASFLDNAIVKFASPNMVKTVDLVQQKNTPWGLDRIDQVDSRGDGVFNYSYDGSGVYVYVVDTGIQLEHEEFGSRASCGYNAVDNSKCNDGNGHGTHVAGIVGGKTYGVAKNTQLVSVKVFDDSGVSYDDAILAGIDYVAEQKKRYPTKSIVMNLSLGGPRSTVINDAVNAAVDAGVVTVVAAGNSNLNACNFSPASAANVITVGSTARGDTMSSFSNVGLCVNIFAPGSNILSSYPNIGSNTGTALLSGTSMASPFVAGTAALHLQKNPESNPYEISSAIIDDALRNKIRFRLFQRQWSPNLLLNIKNLQ